MPNQHLQENFDSIRIFSLGVISAVFELLKILRFPQCTLVSAISSFNFLLWRWMQQFSLEL